MTIRLASAALVLAVVLASSACATPMQARQPATSDSEVQRQLFKLQKDSQRMLALLEEMGADGQGAGANAACAETATRVEELGRNMLVLEEQLLETQAKLDMAIAEIRALRRASTPTYSNADTYPGVTATPGGGGQTPPATAGDEGTTAPAPGPGSGSQDPAPGSATSPEELFNAAYADFSRGKYELALMGFESALKVDPEGPTAETARYYVGETLMAMGRFSDAVQAFDLLLADAPDSPRALTIQYKRGVALFEARRVVEGVQALQDLIEKAPDSDEARLASDYLRTRGIVEE